MFCDAKVVQKIISANFSEKKNATFFVLFSLLTINPLYATQIPTKDFFAQNALFSSPLHIFPQKPRMVDANRLPTAVVARRKRRGADKRSARKRLTYLFSLNLFSVHCSTKSKIIHIKEIIGLPQKALTKVEVILPNQNQLTL